MSSVHPSTFSNISPETTGPIEGDSLGWGDESFSNGPGHMTKMAAMAIYGKNPLKNHLQNQKADDFGTLYVTSGCGAYQVCSNDDPRFH